jgi:hypothetical protein
VALTLAEELALIKPFFNGVRTLLAYLRSGRIQITSPRDLGFLEEGKERLDDIRVSYIVRGKLKQLPRDHEIWLLTEDRSGVIFPQGFSPVQFNKDIGEWVGRVHTQSPRQKIVAVVAPPTSAQLFKYYQKIGPKTNYEPLDRIPVECTNRTSVHVRLPP